jgi:predicted dehydrogenase
LYVEKPMSHTVWEGRKMIEAARKYGRIVQVGTQHRSNAGLQEAARYIRDGHCGKIRYIHAVVHFLRKDIGRRLPWYPDKLNYDQYCGPAPMAPLERTQLHYDFHWYWGTGNGDLGNNGVHALDTAFIFAGHQSFPRRIRSLGGRYVIADGAETPNTMLTLYDYAEVPFVFEHRALPAKPGVNFTDNAHGVRTGVVVRCENGYFAGLVGGVVYDNAGKVVKKFPGDGGAKHMPNFLDAVRSRRDRDLVTPVELGHVGASLCHYGNISYRIGGIASRADARIAVAAIPPAEQHFEHLLEHLAIHGVDLERQPLTLGPWLEIDGDNITRVEAGTDATLEYARFLLRETHRPPYTLPEQI